MGYGNGYPLFNYYAVFPYFIGALISFITGFIWAAKLLFLIPILTGAVSMYLLAKETFNKNAAILASLLYSYAPFKALDTYVRGDVAESFAMAIVPLIIYFCLKLIKNGGGKNAIGISLSVAAFLTSHNIMTVLFSPVIFLLLCYFLFSQKGKNFLLLLISFAIGIGLAAFFVLPAFFEKNLVQIDNLIRLELDFRAHFVTLKQLFLDRSWGYGASTIGDNDTISFQIGWPYWWLAVISVIVFIFNLLTKRKSVNYLVALLFIIFLFSVFMTHVRSAFIWEGIEILKFVQFPWRFLSVTVFSISLLGGYLIYSLKESYGKYILIVLAILTVILNFTYFKPEKFYFDINDQKKLTGELWEQQQKAAILDYLPQTAVQPREQAKDVSIVRSGKAVVEKLNNKSNRWDFKTTVEEKALIEVPVFDFPVWKVWVNGKEVEISNKNYPGRISINLQPGQYLVEGKFTNTSIRSFANAISLISTLLLLGFIFYGKIGKIKS